CRSSFDPKCAKRPLFERPSSPASPPMLRPSSPVRLASRNAKSRMRSRVSSPLDMPCIYERSYYSSRGPRRAHGGSTATIERVTSLARRAPPPAPVSSVRSTLLLAARATLVATGHFDAYEQALPLATRDHLREIIAGTWLPA